ncbi:GNAT family N-acetyltransferase [Rothia sp. LK2588]|uniref:GNAT family N-acetyltransferase n=1 Tax=Rothia sp. LK2588 TaxID=3114369 RepID=UPI0034CD9705
MTAQPNFELLPTTEQDRTYIARLNFLTDVFGAEDGQLSDSFAEDFDFYVRHWDPNEGGLIAWADLVPAGGVWLLWGSSAERGVGFVDESMPELAIAVEPRFRGTGLASLLLDGATKLAQKIGAPGISLAVAYANEKALKVYEHKGFAVVGENDEKTYQIMEKRF